MTNEVQMTNGEKSVFWPPLVRAPMSWLMVRQLLKLAEFPLHNQLPPYQNGLFVFENRNPFFHAAFRKQKASRHPTQTNDARMYLQISSLLSCSAHARNFRQGEDATRNFLGWPVFDFIHTHRIGYIKSAGFCAAERF